MFFPLNFTFLCFINSIILYTHPFNDIFDLVLHYRIPYLSVTWGTE